MEESECALHLHCTTDEYCGHVVCLTVGLLDHVVHNDSVEESDVSLMLKALFRISYRTLELSSELSLPRGFDSMDSLSIKKRSGLKPCSILKLEQRVQLTWGLSLRTQPER